MDALQASTAWLLASASASLTYCCIVSQAFFAAVAALLQVPPDDWQAFVESDFAVLQAVDAASRAALVAITFAEHAAPQAVAAATEFAWLNSADEADPEQTFVLASMELAAKLSKARAFK